MALLVFMLIVCLAPSVHGTSHLMFADGPEVNITNTGCGSTKFCLEDPEDCDPTMAGACLFASIAAGATMSPNGTDLDIQLRGESDGYIALGLTMDPSMGTTMVFACGQDKGTFVFFTRQANNSNSDSNLTATEIPVNKIRGNVTDSLVECEFTIPDANGTYFVQIGTGTLDGTTLGSFVVNKTTTGPLDLASLTNNATMPTTMPTAMPTRMSTAKPTAMPTGMPTAMPTMVSTEMSTVKVQNATTPSSAVTFTSPASLLLWCFFVWSVVLRI